jgi:hypothetical protein
MALVIIKQPRGTNASVGIVVQFFCGLILSGCLLRNFQIHDVSMEWNCIKFRTIKLVCMLPSTSRGCNFSLTSLKQPLKLFSNSWCVERNKM